MATVPDKVSINPDGSFSLKGEGRIETRRGASPARGFSTDEYFFNILAPALGGITVNPYGYTEKQQLARMLLGLTQPGLPTGRSKPPAGYRPSRMSAGVMNVTPPQMDPSRDFYSRRKQAEFDREQRARDLALERRDEELRMQQKISLLNRILGGSLRGGGTETETRVSEDPQLYSNAYRYEVVPITRSTTTTRTRSPFELLQSLGAFF